MERLTWIWNQWINWNNLWSWIANMLTVLSLSLVFYVIIGPTKLWYYEISFVRLFFRASFFCLSMIRFSGAFLQNGSKKFSDFFHKTRISSNLKSDKVRFFWKEKQTKKLVHHFKGPQSVQKVFQVLREVDVWNFYDFLREVTATSVKID